MDIKSLESPQTWSNFKLLYEYPYRKEQVFHPNFSPSWFKQHPSSKLNRPTVIATRQLLVKFQFRVSICLHILSNLQCNQHRIFWGEEIWALNRSQMHNRLIYKVDLPIR